MEQSWVEFYHAAVLETDWSKLEGEILAAEAAIKGRLHEFSLNHGGTPEENQAIVHAVNAMETLRNDLVLWRSLSVQNRNTQGQPECMVVSKQI